MQATSLKLNKVKYIINYYKFHYYEDLSNQTWREYFGRKNEI